MHAWNLERIPLPHFSTYLIYTALSLIGSLIHVTWNATITSETKPSNITCVSHVNMQSHSLIDTCLDDSWCFWSAINCAYCLLICVARELQNIFFGELRSAEDSHIRENFSSFIFYKVVFIYGVLNVDSLHELLLWAAWFSVLGFLQLLIGLIKDRFQFIMQCPDTSPILQAQMVLLSCVLLIAGIGLMGVCIAVGAKHSLNYMFFMLAEVFQLLIITIYVITWYVVYLFCELVSRVQKGDRMYHRAVLLYYTELIFFSVADLGDFIHNLHMLLWNKVQVNMSSIIIGMHLQHLYYKLLKRYKYHRRYRTVLELLEHRFFRVNSPENCAICWEPLQSARQLPCGHIFHADCLYLWIEKNTTCPSCRKNFDDPINIRDSQYNTPTSFVSTHEDLRPLETGLIPSVHENDISSSLNQSVADRGHNDNVRAFHAEAACTDSSDINICSDSVSNLVNPLYHCKADHNSGTSSSISAMVSMNNLLDVHDQLLAENVADMRTEPRQVLPAKFLSALETELLHFFRIPRGNNSQTSSETEFPTESSYVHLHRRINYQSCIPADSLSEQNAYHSLSSSESSPTDEDDKELPPKRVLRSNIRHLLHRVCKTINWPHISYKSRIATTCSEIINSETHSIPIPTDCQIRLLRCESPTGDPVQTCSMHQDGNCYYHDSQHQIYCNRYSTSVSTTDPTEQRQKHIDNRENYLRSVAISTYHQCNINRSKRRSISL